VEGVAAQFDTKRENLPYSSITLYDPLALDTMAWRLTAEQYPNHWSKRIGKGKGSGTKIKELLVREDSFNASAARLQKSFFMAAVNSHCAGPGAYLPSVVIRELFAFAVVNITKRAVNMPSCPIRHRHRAGQPTATLGRSSAVEFLQRHKYAITFENSATSGYMTEKLVSAYVAETIPIYFGPPLSQVENVFNTKAFIYCDIPQHLVRLDVLRKMQREVCPNVKVIDNRCFDLFEQRLNVILYPYYKQCVEEIVLLDADPVKYDQMLSEPLVFLDDQGELTGIWDPREMGKIIRTTMTALGFID